MTSNFLRSQDEFSYVIFYHLDPVYRNKTEVSEMKDDDTSISSIYSHNGI